MDAVQELRPIEERLSALVGVMNAAAAELVELIAEVMERELWRGWGINTPEHWVTLRCGCRGPTPVVW